MFKYISLLLFSFYLFLGTALAGVDFDERCNAPGVIKCIGFDSDSDVLNGNEYDTVKSDATRLKGAGSGGVLSPVFDPNESHSPLTGYRDSRVTIDTAVKSSGAASLRFTIPTRTPANSTGSFRVSFCDFKHPSYSGPCKFGENSTFYIQYRQRFGPNYLNFYVPAGGSSSVFWKTVVIHWNREGCGHNEFAMINKYWQGVPRVYKACGDFDINLYREPYDGGSAWTQWSPPYSNPQSDVTHNVRSTNSDFPNPSGTGYPTGTRKCAVGQTSEPSCLRFVENEWMTFYWVVHTGNWEQPNSDFQVWVSRRPTEPLEQIIDAHQIILEQTDGNPQAIWDMIQLETYMTNKDANLNHTPVQTWYDDLIISSQPIADPVGSLPPNPSQDFTPPDPPANLAVQSN